MKMKCLTEYDAEREREIEREQYREVYLAKGIAEGRTEMGSLMIKLKELGRVDDAFKAAADPEYRERLLKEFGLD